MGLSLGVETPRRGIAVGREGRPMFFADHYDAVRGRLPSHLTPITLRPFLGASEVERRAAMT